MVDDYKFLCQNFFFFMLIKRSLKESVVHVIVQAVFLVQVISLNYLRDL